MQKDELFTIGEFSVITGVGICSLRYYDEIGALKPEYVDPVSNYRYYGYRQLSRIPAINICRDAGIKLSELDFFLQDEAVDYDKLLAESRRSIKKTIDRCRHKERGFDRIEKLSTISSGIRSNREMTADIHSLDIWNMPCDEIGLDAGNPGMLLKLSENAGRYRAHIIPSAYGILRVIDGCLTKDYAFAMLADPDAVPPCNGHHMKIPGGKYLFLAMDSCSMVKACKIIDSCGRECSTDQIMSLTLLSDGASGSVYCAAARLLE